MKRRPQPTFAKNQAELASILGVSRETVGRWLKIPGNPGRRSDGRLPVAEWERWARAHSRLPIGPDAKAMKNRLLEAQAKLVEHRLDVSRRMHVSIEEVDRLAAALSAVIRREVRKIHRIAGALVDKSTVEVEQILRNAEHNLLERLQKAAAGITTR